MTAKDGQGIDAFPPALRALLEAELAAGNTILEVGHGSPAPPVGAWVRLAKRVATRPRAASPEIGFHDRRSSLWSGEWTDPRRFFFVLEPPGPSPPAPDMDALRRAAAPPAALRPPRPAPLAIEVDRRGEMLTCREDGRVATIICTFSGGPRLLPRTLEGWWIPAERRSDPIAPADRAALVGRIVEHCRRLGMAGLTIED
ncbi:hypothetical protein [Neoroseomonas soli]|uniref:Uncharacterized protein n=1 Tax=Neoroseomonas soli TaxID=1081025 RepID=A0A9X9X0C3_9PROT|nr:hypothetical protein [Neoroseomonas soli]MBR0672852.1 hypothetical protein [Neoroseomonas soli]